MTYYAPHERRGRRATKAVLTYRVIAMGFLKRIFGSGDKTAAANNEAMNENEVWDVSVPPDSAAPAPAVAIDLSEDEKAALAGLAAHPDGVSLEVFGGNTGLESMAALYRLDKLVRLGLVKRSRPMFMEPEVYELTENGREMVEDSKQ